MDDDSVDELHTTQRKVAPWVEKYRPEKVDDVSHQEEVVRTLKSAIEHGSIPHLMFYGEYSVIIFQNILIKLLGPPGTGKTTTILALARELYGPELYKSRILELNASDERGISVIREKVKSFAKTSVGTQKQRFESINLLFSWFNY